jgi:tRNA pseudouridine32 synthase / 23S rRNA pseudouridine746 synthase
VNAKFHRRVTVRESVPAVEIIVRETALSKTTVKDWMNKGGVWLSRDGGSMQRLRRATRELKTNDVLELYYDAALLARCVDSPECRSENAHYSVWYKPAGMLSQGTSYGDHCALLRYAEQRRGEGELHLIHRLDREARGLVLIAHQSKAAARLSALFREGRVEKYYRVAVRGDVARVLGDAGEINALLEGKSARTAFTCLEYDTQADVTQLRVKLYTGRTHQIRRHFAGAGFPVMGDPTYGQGNKNTEGLQLVASELGFVCPWLRKSVVWRD